jgi:hypothetical protein
MGFGCSSHKGTCLSKFLKRKQNDDIGFEAITPLVMNRTLFCDITMCSPLKIKPTSSRSNNSGALVRQRTIPTEQPPLVGKVNANFSG